LGKVKFLQGLGDKAMDTDKGVGRNIVRKAFSGINEVPLT